MIFSTRRFARAWTHGLLLAAVISAGGRFSIGQSGGTERRFPQSKAAVEKALKEMQAATAGRLPVLEGFATSPDRSLDRFQRGYYQSKFQVSAAPSGGSMVRVSVQVTAWYADPVASKAGYQVLTSNGRLEADLLDQLTDQLAGKAVLGGASSATTEARKQFPSERTVTEGSSSKPATERSSSQLATAPDPAEPSISAPVPRLPETGGFSSSLSQGLADQEKPGSQTAQNPTGQKKMVDEDQNRLLAEVQGLEEILKNQARPKNLVAVKKNGTPVVATASLTAKTLFMASAHDEFEMLDFGRDWVHVRISGLSRGWIWRNNVELPDGIPDGDLPPVPASAPVAADIFRVTREETAPFPGDWAPLRGKSVKIVSVEKIDESGKDAGSQLRLEFAKSVLDKDYAELAEKTQQLAGIVVIFDAADGGMIAAAFPTLQQWKAGKLSDAGLWHQCFFDPPETFNESGPSASQ